MPLMDPDLLRPLLAFVTARIPDIAAVELDPTTEPPVSGEGDSLVRGGALFAAYIVYVARQEPGSRDDRLPVRDLRLAAQDALSVVWPERVPPHHLKLLDAGEWSEFLVGVVGVLTRLQSQARPELAQTRDAAIRALVEEVGEG